MEYDPTRMCELLVGLGDVEVLSVGDEGGGPLRVHVRWRFACGVLDVDGGGFCHTVLVGMRARLAASGQPRRIFDAVLVAAPLGGGVVSAAGAGLCADL